MSAWELRPEVKFERAQDALRGVVVRVKTLLEVDAAGEMGPDDVEVLSLQMKLAAVNLMCVARDLREVEEERRFLAREMERNRLRFEPEPEEVAA